MKDIVKGYFFGSVFMVVFMTMFLLVAKAFADGPIPGIDSATGFLSSPPALVLYAVTFIMDMVKRYMPSKDPAGALHTLRDMLTIALNFLVNIIKAGCDQFIAFVNALAQFLDKLLGQNLQK